MKIAVITGYTPSLFLLRCDMMKAFINKGHNVVAIGNESESKWSQKFKEIGIRYRQINISRNGTNPFQDLSTFNSIKNVLSEERPDKIFCYQAKSVIYGSLAAKSLGITEVYPLIAGIGSIFLSEKLKDKIIRLLLIIQYKIALKNCSTIFFQNTDDSETFVGYHILNQNKITYLNGSGVNIEKFTPKPIPSSPVFINITRLIKDKGVVEYLEACRIVKKRHPEYRCLLIGPFDTNPSAITEDELNEYIDEGIVEYCGEQLDVRPYLNQSSILVLPSYREGTPKAVLEAMASGRAVITTDAPGCRETVQNGINGYLVPVKDIEALAEKMIVLAENPFLVKQMGIEGRKIAENKFSVDIVNAKIIKSMNL